MAANSQPTSFILPDILSYFTYPLIYHPNGGEIAKKSIEWLESNCPDLSPKCHRAVHDTQAAELGAFCYNYTTSERLSVLCDFLVYVFHLDDISDGMMTRDTDMLANVVMNALWFSDRYKPTNAPGKEQPAEEPSPGKLARDFWARCIIDAGPGVQERFKAELGLFLEAINFQSKARDTGIITDLDSYIVMRRYNSGVNPCLVLIEYALDIDLPDYVVEHHIIQELNRWTNDFLGWTNDLFSYSVERARGDTFNMIEILIRNHGHTLQSAVDRIGDLCGQCIAGFERDREQLPSWGPKIDVMVKKYVEGLQNWIVGTIHWSFQTHRYFGPNGAQVKNTGLVPLSLRAGEA